MSLCRTYKTRRGQEQLTCEKNNAYQKKQVKYTPTDTDTDRNTDKQTTKKTLTFNLERDEHIY